MKSFLQTLPIATSDTPYSLAANQTGIIPDERKPPDVLERWFSEDIDVPHDPVVGGQIQAFLRQHQARSVVVTDRALGCPPEEGIHYPDGPSCPPSPHSASPPPFPHDPLPH